ncbi:MAG: glycyl radical protein [Gemmatimonadetes bacterium]|nr:glycyl radical protein [Gemmatimonadota bacterium]
MSERVARLRERSQAAVPRVSAERARLLTEFYAARADQAVSTPVLRAQAFAYLMEHKTVWIGADELIVGERGEAPRATPTFPELCCHTVQDLDILDSREKIPFRVAPEVRSYFEETAISFWRGRTMRERIFAAMTPEWLAAYEAGVFTEFMEQRAPGHTVLDDKIYRKGMLDFARDIDAALAGLDFLGDPRAWAKQQELNAMRIAVHGLIRFAERHAEHAEALAAAEADPVRRGELERIAAVCRHVPAHAPRDFHEALQYYWFVHLGVVTELNTWDAFNPGHIDQHLLPFYRAGLANGSLTEADARELLQCFWIKFNNQPAPPKVGVTAAESGTYTDFALLNVGGLRPDGEDATSELTYLVLDVIQELRLLQPSSCVLVSRKNPDRLLRRAGKIIRTGYGQPSLFNHDAIIQELVRHGKKIEDARAGGASGCVEIGAFGKENYNLTGYFNLPKVLELALHDGIDPRSGKRVGTSTGDAASFATFADLFAAFERQLRYLIDVKIRGNNVIERLYAEHMPAPFLSVLIDDCIARGTDYHDGGARYDSSYIQGVGIGTVTDSLSALSYHVYDHGTISLPAFRATLDLDFKGEETLRQQLLNRTPKYGNDDDYADAVLRRVFEAYFGAIDGRPNTRGGRYRINLLPTTVHVYFGSCTGATADGRHAGKPLSEGISPVQGADRHGPAAVLRSAAKIDHLRTGGTLLNQKLTPQLLRTDADLDKFAQLVRSYFRLDGHHIQFNVVDAATLRAAQADPGSNRDLIVRVAGYSDYFCDLSWALQDEILVRSVLASFVCTAETSAKRQGPRSDESWRLALGPFRRPARFALPCGLSKTAAPPTFAVPTGRWRPSPAEPHAGGSRVPGDPS